MASPRIDPPQLMGVTGDECASCNATTVPLYDLSCHTSDDFHCRNCLTYTFYQASDDIVRCPHSPCGLPAGFPELAPLTKDFHLDNYFYDQERIDKIREQPEVMDNLICFTSQEVIAIFYHVYSMFEDQILDPVAFGGVPGYFIKDTDETLRASFDLNPFVCGFLIEMGGSLKLVSTPKELEEGMLSLLNRLLHDYASMHYGTELSRWGVDLTSEEDVLKTALENYKPLGDIKENWEMITKKWVELLAWRHVERLAPPEGGAAERRDFKF
ncbi:hypothetical protein ACJQWK_08939 [Exserohilum turcicum]|uniref:Uncharacterized protein n=1 Tax=Exserohilum turcicum (strain 28A) TaxID=671987 RepID=R0KEQ9_EXST2|nr:uncharacterized protein SETTUDRAFT_30935 [Exserohilum turcica Et28A]EOA86602.1 hypothetical protein SETTUDRAFT_30935 [Exserohilum turcica Et28A]